MPPRWLPQSLFGRLVLVLAGGLLVAQLLSAAINLAERDRLLLHAGGMQQAQRIADGVKLLDAFGPAERER
ncbi:MAG TPA: two-component sensor histidine kinase, partial [Ramlibacter sp.]